MTPPRCGTCRHFRVGPAMLDPVKGERVVFGSCFGRADMRHWGATTSRDGCAEHEPEEQRAA